MDPLSVGAGIIAIIQAADRIAQLCRYYIGAIDDYPKDLRVILIEISTLQALFENIKFLMDSDGSSSPMLKILGGKEGPLTGCRSTISELELLFPASPPQITSNAHRRKRLKDVVSQLAWPFHKKRPACSSTALCSTKGQSASPSLLKHCKTLVFCSDASQD